MNYKSPINFWLLTATMLCLIVFPARECRGQSVIIEGEVEVAPMEDGNVQMGGAGYQSVAGNNQTERETSSEQEILLWLERQSDRISMSPESGVKILDQKNKAFIPKLLGVKKGESVRIVNSDEIYHNVFSLSSTKRFDVGRRPPDEYVEVEFNQTGIVNVFCDIHSDMHAVIVVMPETTIASKHLKGEGKFRFENIPEGKYELHFYAEGDRRKSIVIKAVKMKKITLETVRLGS